MIFETGIAYLSRIFSPYVILILPSSLPPCHFSGSISTSLIIKIFWRKIIRRGIPKRVKIRKILFKFSNIMFARAGISVSGLAPKRHGVVDQVI